MENNEILKKLNSVNWNFDFSIPYGAGMLRPFNCRKYYSYPATFIPEIPYTLIEILSQKGDVVVDPFGGIGTTFMQALSLERIPFTFDINVVASNVCTTLYRLLDPTIDHENIRDLLVSLPERYNSVVDYACQLSSCRAELSGWFEQETFNELAYLFVSYDHLEITLAKAVLELVLSSILTTLSSQNKGWAYIADNVKPKPDELRRKDVFKQYLMSTTSLFNDINSHLNILESVWEDYIDFYDETARTQRVFDNSILMATINNCSVDLVITSPPYPKMIDYVKSQRLSFCFYERDFHEYVQNEIGARYRRTRKDALESYTKSVKQHIDKMKLILKTGGYLCLVLPDYDDNAKEKNRRKAISEIVNYCFELGLNKIFELGRYIPSHKRTLSIQWATLVNERIFIFQKR